MIGLLAAPGSASRAALDKPRRAAFATLALPACTRSTRTRFRTRSARRRRAAAARADTGLLRLLRLALGGARALAAGAHRAAVSPGRRRGCARRTCAEPHPGEHQPRGQLLPAIRARAYERPYGLAWLLALAAELRAGTTRRPGRVAALAPLEGEAAQRMRAGCQSFTIRSGSASTARRLSLSDWCTTGHALPASRDAR